MKQTTIEEVSAGGVVFRRISESANQRISYQFLLGKHSGYHKWVLPKGLVERGESYTETAVREVEEEVGVKAEITSQAPVKSIEYYYFADFPSAGSGQVIKGMGANGEQTERRVKKYQEDGGGKVRVHKKVVFYLMELVEELPKHGWEMEERKWVDYKEGMELLAFPTEREVFEVARKILDGAPAGT